MGERTSSSSTPVLSYVTPAARRGRPVLGAVVALLGVGITLFGELMLYFGIARAIYLVATRADRTVIAADVWVVLMLLLIGSVCLYAGARWCRAVPGIIAGAGNDALRWAGTIKGEAEASWRDSRTGSAS